MNLVQPPGYNLLAFISNSLINNINLSFYNKNVSVKSKFLREDGGDTRRWKTSYNHGLV